MNKSEVFMSLCFSGAKPYKPKMNRKRQAGTILTAFSGEAVLPLGITGYLVKKFIRAKPLFLYK